MDYSQNKKTVNIYGGGSAALILAFELAKSEKFDIRIYERNKALARKFLVAGKGGFNLTHNLEFKELSKYYRPAGFLDTYLQEFDSVKFRNWLARIGISTFVGSSNRVFPVKGIKPIEVLQAIMKGLEGPNVHIYYNARFIGFKDGVPTVEQGEKAVVCNADFHVYAFGGSSWTKTGSDGHWLKIFREERIKVNGFGAANCGLEVKWNKDFIKKHEGKHVKNIAMEYNSFGKKGEFTITKYGIEGNAVYPISSAVSEALKLKKEVSIGIDLKPQLSYEAILSKLDTSIANKRSVTSALKSLKISAVAIDMLKLNCTKTEWTTSRLLATKIKSFSLSISGHRPLDECISTTGGISTTALDNNLMFVQKPNHFCIGEMVDWDAPTGGFLLQACFAMGYSLSKRLQKL